jgi:transposase
MARFKQVDYGQMKLVPVRFKQQIVPGSFEYALSYLIDHELDLSAFEARFCNDEVGAPAYAPAVLLKIVLLAYSKGLISSRDIEAACRENVVFMAISGDSAPHFTTIAQFISTLGEPIGKLFAQVLVVCARQGLVGRQMFAIDGVKLPSNASKAKSGSRADFEYEAQKMEAALAKIIERHRDNDAKGLEPDQAAREQRHIQRLEQEAGKIRRWLQDNPQERRGPKGSLRQSNRTDNESAKMATAKGVIQGYTAVAAVDEKHQIVVEAQAHGVGQEQELLLPLLDAVQPMLTAGSALSADAGYNSEANLQQLKQRAIDAYIPDGGWRKRDARFAEQQRQETSPMRCGTRPPRATSRACSAPSSFAPPQICRIASARPASACTATAATTTSTALKLSNLPVPSATAAAAACAQPACGIPTRPWCARSRSSWGAPRASPSAPSRA